MIVVKVHYQTKKLRQLTSGTGIAGRTYVKCGKDCHT